VATGKVVADASPLIYLAVLGRFMLLQRLFGVVHVPDAVVQEVAAPTLSLPGAAETRTAVADGWLRPTYIRDREAVEDLLTDLHQGEAEAIVLAKELEARLLMLDDRLARNRAVALGLPVTGTIGVLLLARRRGEQLDLRHDLDTLIQHGFLYRAVLECADPGPRP
jgi:predicted nucleic acid-binding protein